MLFLLIKLHYYKITIFTGCIYLRNFDTILLNFILLIVMFGLNEINKTYAYLNAHIFIEEIIFEKLFQFKLDKICQ